MSNKIVLIGSGAREDALGRRIKESGASLFTVMSNQNPSLNKISEKVAYAEPDNYEKILNFIEEVDPDLVYVSPDGYLATPLVDRLEVRKYRVASPNSKAFQIESSKIYMRQLIKRFGIPGNIKFQTFNDVYELQKFLNENSKMMFAIKPSGLTGGKGVKVMGDQINSIEDAIEYGSTLIEKDKLVLVEEKIQGIEFSIQAFTDGQNFIFGPVAQDNKRLLENDIGPNTGGMGSITDWDGNLPFLDKETIEKAKDITKKIVSSIYSDGSIFRGVIYPQFMFTGNDVKIIEVNGRIADPEGINMISLLEGNVVDILFAISEGSLSENMGKFRKKASVVKYLVPPGYGTSPQKTKLKVNSNDLKSNFRIYYASVNGEIEEFETTSSRSLALYAEADSIFEASEIIERNLWRIEGDYFMRHDIGTRKNISSKMNFIYGKGK
ncbi:phosphoribosylamine--glycine ligase [Caldiplasma sukawensis]